VAENSGNDASSVVSRASRLRGIMHRCSCARTPLWRCAYHRNAIRFVKEAETDAVTLEGAGRSSARIAAIVDEGIAVLGHVGLTHQTVTQLGRYKVQGRTAEGGQAPKLFTIRERRRANGTHTCTPRTRAELQTSERQ
jgi:hypothetical protein